jgi:hypothetical protein
MKGRTVRTAKKRREFLDALSKTGNVSHAARTAVISRRAVYEWRNEDESFKAEWDDAVEQATDLLEIEARRRAVEGTVKPVFYQGEKCGEIHEYSDVLLMFLIKGKRPEYATERREHTGKDGGPQEHNVRVTQADYDERARRSREEMLRELEGGD